MRIYDFQIKQKAITLRKRGYSYSEINIKIGKKIPKATLAHWMSSLSLPKAAQLRLEKRTEKVLAYARERSVAVRYEKRINHLKNLLEKNTPLLKALDCVSVKKLIIATLYLAEGTKGQRNGLVFGNSNPEIIQLFLALLRESFSINETKFRITIQARADQDLKGLEGFWQKITGVPASQFYATRVDPRSVGKKSKKLEYKGVCRINYFSNDLLSEVMTIGTLLTWARSSAG